MVTSNFEGTRFDSWQFDRVNSKGDTASTLTTCTSNADCSDLNQPGDGSKPLYCCATLSYSEEIWAGINTRDTK